MASDTPRPLLDALDAVTAPRPRSAASIAGPFATAESLHLRRVRTTFEDKNIVAVGISEKQTARKPTGELSLCFYVEKKLSTRRLSRDQLIPPVVAAPQGKAVFTDVKEIGRVRPEAAPLKRLKPIVSGYSIAHPNAGAGTVGAIVRKGKKYFVLSNSHVLADAGLATVGDDILYPGSLDGGKPTNIAGTLARFIRFKVGGDFRNRVDAALCAIDRSRLDDLDFEIFGLNGSPRIIAPRRGMKVTKRGRTTGETSGQRITDVNFRVVIHYDGVGPVGFLDQVLCERYSRPGDSGSVVCDEESGAILGLHFAGAKGGSVFTPMALVVDALDFRFATA